MYTYTHPSWDGLGYLALTERVDPRTLLIICAHLCVSRVTLLWEGGRLSECFTYGLIVLGDGLLEMVRGIKMW